MMDEDWAAVDPAGYWQSKYEEMREERDGLLVAIERWKIEELRQLQCQCAKPQVTAIDQVLWCIGCERPTQWEDVQLRPDERALMERAAVTVTPERSAPK